MFKHTGKPQPLTPLSSIFSSGYASKSKEDLDDGDFIQKSIDNNNLVLVKPNHNFNLKCH